MQHWPPITSIVACTLGLAMGQPGCLAGEQKAVVLYVDDDAPEGGDGRSWNTALRYLQDALGLASQPKNDVSEIRVGQGVHKTDQGTGQTSGDVNATFLMPSGIALRGGYAGLGAADADARDFELYESVLSGDLLGNDGPPGSFQNYEDNSIHILTALNTDGFTLVEGLSFTASNADFANSAFGGGIVCDGGRPTISQCTFRLNEAYGGGGVYLHQSGATVQNCRFQQNRVLALATGWGGGILLWDGRPSISDCVFESNETTYGDGGGLYVYQGEPTLTRCTFVDNYAGSRGGGAMGGGILIDCNFVDNVCAEDGGGLRGNGTMINCQFAGNYASVYGGGVSGGGTIVNCRFIDNFSSFKGGAGLYGGGTLVNCEFRHNLCGGNQFLLPGGAGVWVRSDSTFTNCLFNANDSWGPGGGVYIDPDKTGSFFNCTFTNNITIGDSGGAISGNADICNSILWNNSPSELNGAFDVSHSCIQNGWPGEGNILVDPQFMDALGADSAAGTDDDDLHLAAGSPCIDAGDNTILPLDIFDLDGDTNIEESVSLDLDSQLRTVNDPRTPNTGYPVGAPIVVDLGSFEFCDFTLAGDVIPDGVVNVLDLLAVLRNYLITA